MVNSDEGFLVLRRKAVYLPKTFRSLKGGKGTMDLKREILGIFMLILSLLLVVLVIYGLSTIPVDPNYTPTYEPCYICGIRW
jgi:hypothetical protein